MDYVEQAMARENEDLGQRNSHDPKVRDKLNELEYNRRYEELAYLREMMESHRGRRWLRGIINIGNPYKESYAPGGAEKDDYHSMGTKKIPLKLITDIKLVAPDLLQIFEEEKYNDDRKQTIIVNNQQSLDPIELYRQQEVNYG